MMTNKIDIRKEIVELATIGTNAIDTSPVAGQEALKNTLRSIQSTVQAQAQSINRLIDNPAPEITEADKQNAVSQFNEALASIEENLQSTLVSNPAEASRYATNQMAAVSANIQSTLNPALPVSTGSASQDLGHAVGHLTGSQRLAGSVPLGISAAKGMAVSAFETAASGLSSLVTPTANKGTNLFKMVALTIGGTALLNTVCSKLIGSTGLGGLVTTGISIAGLVIGGAVAMAYFNGDMEAPADGYNPYRPNATPPTVPTPDTAAVTYPNEAVIVSDPNTPTINPDTALISQGSVASGTTFIPANASDPFASFDTSTGEWNSSSPFGSFDNAVASVETVANEGIDGNPPESSMIELASRANGVTLTSASEFAPALAQ